MVNTRKYRNKRVRAYGAVDLMLCAKDTIELMAHGRYNHIGKALMAALKAHAGKTRNAYQLQCYMMDEYGVEHGIKSISHLLKAEPFRRHIKAQRTAMITDNVARAYRTYEYDIAKV